MKVLVISTVYPSSSRTTFGIFVHEQVKQLIKLGMDIKVVCPIAIVPPLRLVKPKKGILKEWKTWIEYTWKIPNEVTLEGVQIYYPRWVLLPKMYFIQFEALALYHSIKALFQRIWKDWEFDIIHAHFLVPNGITAQLFAQKYKIPIVISCLGADLNHYARIGSMSGSVKSALSYSKFIICKSPQLRDVAMEFGAAPERVQVIYNGCDLTEFNSIKKNKKKYEILFIGHFIERKCLNCLVEAFHKLKNVKVKLRLIGDGELMPQIKKIVLDYKLHERVIFQGIVPHSQIPVYLNNATLLCLPSRSEGTPNVVMEALACGTPVVASGVGGVSDIVPDFCGILVPSQDVGALKNALDQALERDWKHQEIRTFAEENLSAEGQCKKIIQIYKKSIVPG